MGMWGDNDGTHSHRMHGRSDSCRGSYVLPPLTSQTMFERQMEVHAKLNAVRSEVSVAMATSPSSL